jgi:formate dehydrogenase subunit delta
MPVHDDQLVKMANEIGAFFRAEPDHDQAVGGIVDHIVKFWTPRMREKLLARAHAGGSGLDDLPLEAVRRLAAGPGAPAERSPARP